MLVRVDTVARSVVGRDCDDEDNNRRPDQVEICNGRDDNCNDRVDEDFRGGPCGTGLPGVCAPGTNTCTAGRLTCVPTVAPSTRAETCNGIDDDCDGDIDEATPGATSAGVASRLARSCATASTTTATASSTRPPSARAAAPRRRRAVAAWSRSRAAPSAWARPTPTAPGSTRWWSP
ncbi:MAG: putative metal-binding motif-containing protein [Deltaproteobacteria bacterium]|nr:putative metal-binding motif-containing protein [Deltaproteobacteria bacterium]